MADFHTPQPYVQITSPEWTKDAVIYQINTRQFSAKGTFAAAQEHLPRLKSLGVDIVWLMPIHPIGEKNRKGRLGSPYSVKDYFAVNPELGDLVSLKDFVDRAHQLGMRVILDWVANHSAWDNPLVDSHPHWYAKDHQGNFRPTPWWDWDDIIDFDYSQRDLREYMASAMCYWVKEADIDSFRCDVAGFVPNDFWQQVRKQLEQIKPVFMLAEWESKDLHQHGFDMTYAWSWNEWMHDIAMGRAGLEKLYKYYSWNEKSFPREAHRMTFVSNHDKNAWDGTEFEQFGDALHCAMVLSVLGEGMPLIYNGQEAGNSKRLAFFEKDPIPWCDHANGDLYRDLIKLKKKYSALHNAQWGARMVQVINNCCQKVFSFVRRDDNSGVLVLLNFSDQELAVSLTQGPFEGRYSEFKTVQSNEQKSHIYIDEGSVLTLPAWGWKVYEQS
jgi:glycosidase